MCVCLYLWRRCRHVLDHVVQIPDKGIVKVGLVLLKRARERVRIATDLADMDQKLSQRSLAHADIVVELLGDLTY